MQRAAAETLTRVVVLTADPALEQTLAAAHGRIGAMQVAVLAPAQAQSDVTARDADVLVVDLDAAPPEGGELARDLIVRLAGRTPVIAVTREFNEAVARTLLQLRIADFLLKPVTPTDLMRTCARVLQQGSGAAAAAAAEIFTFLPASGGVGVTTLAIQTALLLLRNRQRHATSTCLVDLDLQQGACADYLDLAPCLDLDEIEPRPERLDAQLLEVMLSQHSSGLAVIAAPSRPAEMRSFDPDVVTRLLDLVSLRFDYIVLDMPRTWFPWTDNVLLGSNKVFIVTEATVPGLRHANALVAAIRQRLGDAIRPAVIVNRFEQRLFASGLRLADIKAALGDAFAGTIPNNYRLVREAIDRGVPLEEIKARNNVAAELKKLALLPQAARPAAAARGRGWWPPGLLAGRLGAAS